MEEHSKKGNARGEEREDSTTATSTHTSNAITPRRWFNSVALMQSSAAPILTVCIPYFRFDIGALLAELLRQAATHKGRIEVLIGDDGSDDKELARRLFEASKNTQVPVSALIFPTNIGRASIRNQLALAAAGKYVLFLDADMYPDTDHFLECYLRQAENAHFDVVVGGRSYSLIRTVTKHQRLYHYYSLRAECLPAHRRQATGWRHIFTNNVMARKELLIQIPFDAEYIGWGYEDTDWALRVIHSNGTVHHINNTATHFGLIDDGSLLQKYRESVLNFQRLLNKFPAEIQLSPVYRLARVLAHISLPRPFLVSLCETFVAQPRAPVVLRYFVLQCFKALIYADVARERIAFI